MKQQQKCQKAPVWTSSSVTSADTSGISYAERPEKPAQVRWDERTHPPCTVRVSRIKWAAHKNTNMYQPCVRTAVESAIEATIDRVRETK